MSGKTKPSNSYDFRNASSTLYDNFDNIITITVRDASHRLHLALGFSIFIPHYIKVRGIMLYPLGKNCVSYPSDHLRVLTYDFEIWYKAE